MGNIGKFPAAFGRLCVETVSVEVLRVAVAQPPSGGCVLKPADVNGKATRIRPAAFGRLCVETVRVIFLLPVLFASRLRAAVC